MARLIARTRAKAKPFKAAAKGHKGKRMSQMKLSTVSTAKMVKGAPVREIVRQPKNDWHGKPDTGPKVPK
jgi:hypothetical protein